MQYYTWYWLYISHVSVPVSSGCEQGRVTNLPHKGSSPPPKKKEKKKGSIPSPAPLWPQTSPELLCSKVACVAIVTSSWLLCKVTCSAELLSQRTGITNVLQVQAWCKYSQLTAHCTNTQLRLLKGNDLLQQRALNLCDISVAQATAADCTGWN